MALKQSGAEIAQGDLDDPAGLRSLLSDCDAVFGVTNYWEHGEKEFAQGRNLVDAIRHSNVQHTILSTLPHTKLLSGGRLEVPHFDTKARIEEYAPRIGAAGDIPACRVLLREFPQLLSAAPAGTTERMHSAFRWVSTSRGDCCGRHRRPGGRVAGGVVLVSGQAHRRSRRRSACRRICQIMAQTLHRKIEYRYIDHARFCRTAVSRRAFDLADMFEFNCACMCRIARRIW